MERDGDHDAWRDDKDRSQWKDGDRHPHAGHPRHRPDRLRTRHSLTILWLKAFHIIFVVTWFAGLFYLPRLFVYHCTCTDKTGDERFKTMERKLFAIMSVGGIAAVAFGVSLLPWWSEALASGTWWLWLKLLLVGVLVAFHIYCAVLVRRFRTGTNTHGERYFRLINEVPALVLIAIVVLVVVKPA